MSKETLLKKDFKESDVQRIRNIVNKKKNKFLRIMLLITKKTLGVK